VARVHKREKRIHGEQITTNVAWPKREKEPVQQSKAQDPSSNAKKKAPHRPMCMKLMQEKENWGGIAAPHSSPSF